MSLLPRLDGDAMENVVTDIGSDNPDEINLVF